MGTRLINVADAKRGKMHVDQSKPMNPLQRVNDVVQLTILDITMNLSELKADTWGQARYPAVGFAWEIDEAIFLTNAFRIDCSKPPDACNFLK